MTWKTVMRDQSLNAATIALVAVAVWRLGLSAELPAVVAFIVGGVLLAVIDWKVKRLPRRLVYLTLAGVFAGQVFASAVQWNLRPLAMAVVGAVLFTSALLVVWFVGRTFTGVMLVGFGDVRLASVLGLLLGWYGLSFVLYGAIAGNVLAIAVAAGTSVRDRTVHVRYSFGPPLIAGALAVVLVHG